MPTNAINDTGVKYLYDKLHGEIEEISNIVDDSTSHKSGNPISITGLKSTQNAINPVITLEPIQDLHGQDKPYPAGGGKNKLPLVLDDLKTMNTLGTWNGSNYTYGGITFSVLTDNSGNVTGIKATGTATHSSSYVIFYFAGATSYHTLDYYGLIVGETYCLSGCPSGGSASTYSLVLSGGNTSNITDTGSSSTFTVDSTSTYSYQLRIYNGYAIPSTGLIFYPQIELGTSKTTFAPYSNECPISGYDKIEVLSCGKNLFDKGLLLDQAAWNTFELTLKPNTTYTMSTNELESKTSELPAYFFNENISPSSNQLVYSGHSVSVLTTSQGIVKIQQRRISGTDSFQNYNWQIEENNQATTYSPYHKTTDLSYDLPETVYKGSLDVETGKLTVDGAIADFKDLTWSRSNNGGAWPYYYFYANNINMHNSPNTENDILCSVYPKDIGRGLVNANDKSIITANSSYIYIRDDSYTDPSVFKTAMTGQKIVYELATPFTIQLTPTELTLLKDYADVSTNGTRIDLDYRNGEMATLEDVLDAQNKLQEEIDNPISYDGKNYRFGIDATGLYLYNITDDTKAYIQMVTT